MCNTYSLHKGSMSRTFSWKIIVRIYFHGNCIHKKAHGWFLRAEKISRAQRIARARRCFGASIDIFQAPLPRARLRTLLLKHDMISQDAIMPYYIPWCPQIIRWGPYFLLLLVVLPFCWNGSWSCADEFNARFWDHGIQATCHVVQCRCSAECAPNDHSRGVCTLNLRFRAMMEELWSIRSLHF